MSSLAFGRDSRLRRRAQFLRVQRRGKRVHTAHFVVILLPSEEPDGERRLGVTVTRKVANAVGRNRVKRVVREVFRRNRELFPMACDIVIIAKRGAPSVAYASALAELEAASAAMRQVARRLRGAQTWTRR